MFKENKKMKKIVILGGNDQDNIKWVNKICRLYNDSYNVVGLYFDHWYNNSKVDIEKEILKMSKLEINDETIIISKSLGTVVTLLGILKKKIIPKKIVLIGLPLKYCCINQIDIESLLNDCSNLTSIYVIQQKKDPQGNYEEINSILPHNVTFMVIKGCNHVYSNYKTLKSIIDQYIST